VKKEAPRQTTVGTAENHQLKAIEAKQKADHHLQEHGKTKQEIEHHEKAHQQAKQVVDNHEKQRGTLKQDWLNYFGFIRQTVNWDYGDVWFKPEI
jgi:ABC-type microcin C transport system permease subunit YejB